MGFTLYHIGVLDNCPGVVQFGQSNITVRELISLLKEKFGEEVDEIILDRKDGDKINAEIVILVNGFSVHSLQGLDTVIPDQAQVMLTFLLAGG